MRTYQPDQELRITISREQVLKTVKNTKKMIKHGLDKLRYEHLHALLGKNPEQNPDEIVFGNVFAALLTKIANGEFPIPIQPAFKDNELIAIFKSVEPLDCRPIGPCGVIRKLVASSVMASIQHQIKNYFGKLQYAMDSCGTEKIIHSFRAQLSLDNSKDIFAMDGKNAFNEANRIFGLHQIQKNFPSALPFIRMMYSNPAKMWYFTGIEHGAQAISSAQGFQQGDPTATWCFAMTIQPFLQEINNILGDSGFVKFSLTTKI